MMDTFIGMRVYSSPLGPASRDLFQSQIACAACYLTKPVQIAALLEQVDALLLQD